MLSVPCATCGDPITRILVSDPRTCAFCQRILGKRYDKAQEPKPPRQPKIRTFLTGRLHITERIHDPNWQLSWCMMPVHEIQIQGSHYPDPCTMLMMKEEYEEDRKYQRVANGQRVEVAESDWEYRRISALLSTARP
jgi:hypothetical protein